MSFGHFAQSIDTAFANDQACELPQETAFHHANRVSQGERGMAVKKTWVAVAFSVVLCACGGGGGGGDNAGGSGTQTSGLVPASLALGAQLTTDATTLRPLRPGAVWTYHGSSTSGPGAAAVGYTSQTTQSAQATGVLETGSNPDDGGIQTVGIAVAGSSITSTQSLNLTGTDETIVVTELRSPVQVNDQYTLVDRHYDNCNCDVDGDGKNDALDVAIYTVVIGQQTLTFDNLPPMAAIEVDTVFLVRYKMSTTGQFTPVARATQRVWYAAGIGVVRRSTTEPIDVAGDVAVTDEQLASWDGITEGVGALPKTTLTVPASNPVLPGAMLRSLLGQFAFGDHGLLVTGLTDDAYTGGSVLSTIDLRGNLTAAQTYPTLPHDVQTLMTSNDVGLFHFESDLDATSTLSMTRFDPSGSIIGALEVRRSISPGPGDRPCWSRSASAARARQCGSCGTVFSD